MQHWRQACLKLFIRYDDRPSLKEKKLISLQYYVDRSPSLPVTEQILRVCVVINVDSS